MRIKNVSLIRLSFFLVDTSFVRTCYFITATERMTVAPFKVNNSAFIDVNVL